MAFAQSSLNTSDMKLDDSKPSTPAVTDTKNSFGIQQSQYTSYGLPEYRNGASNQNSSLVLRLNDSVEKNGFVGKFNGKDEWSGTEQWNYGDVFEIYGAFKTEHMQVTLGRKLETWSTWDSEWQQGFFQPRYLENGLRPEAAGLTGAFLNAHDGHFSTTLAYLPLFIPDFGAHFYVADNHFFSRNPWFHPPTTTYKLGSGFGDIHYKLDHDSEDKIINHPGGAAKFEYHDGGFSSRLSGAYKPMPAFVLGFPSRGVQVQPNANYFDLSVRPRVAYDRLVNLDNQYTAGRWTISGSVAYDHPDDNNGPSEYTSQNIRAAEIFSGFIERRLNEAGPHATSVRVGFLKVNGGDADDSGEFATPADTLFTRRFEYYEAYMVALRTEFHRIFGQTLDNELRAIYDRKQGGGAVTLTSGMDFLRHTLRTELQVDFIGLLTSNADITDGYLSEYRANTRVGLGVNYVF